MTASIIPISRPNRRYCGTCVNGYSGGDGLYCAFYREFISNEACATDCEFYEATEQVVPKKKSKRRAPAPWSPSHEEAVAYIRSLHTTLWGKQIFVAKEDDLNRAADWVVQMFADLKQHAAEEGSAGA